MPAYTQDAKKLSLLYDWGLLSDDDIIGWAEVQTAQLASPPLVLLELADTKPGSTPSIIAYLHSLSSDAQFWPACRDALWQLHDHLLAQPQDTERMAYTLYHSVLNGAEVPEELNFLSRYDDAFDLAKAGVSGDLASVRDAFIKELERFMPA